MTLVCLDLLNFGIHFPCFPTCFSWFLFALFEFGKQKSIFWRFVEVCFPISDFRCLDLESPIFFNKEMSLSRFSISDIQVVESGNIVIFRRVLWCLRFLILNRGSQQYCFLHLWFFIFPISAIFLYEFGNRKNHKFVRQIFTSWFFTSEVRNAEIRNLNFLDLSTISLYFFASIVAVHIS